MKALILSGGSGTRLRPITFSYAKQLIPVANRPILFYVLDDIADAGIKKAGIVIDKQTGYLIKEAVGDGEQWGLNITYIVQDSPRGLAHAVKIARPFIGDDNFVMYLGDNILRRGIKSFVNEYGNNGEDINILLTEVDNPQQFGVAVLDNDNNVKRLVEKPVNFISNKALVGIYIFNHKIFRAVNSIKPSWRGELEITDAIQYLIDHGGKVLPYLIDGWWKDTGKKEDVLEVNRFLLEDLNPTNYGQVASSSHLSGRIALGQESIIKNSVIAGPVAIGESCLIEDSYIGPYTSLGSGVQVINSELEKSIVMENTRISGIQKRIANSLIGRDVVIEDRKSKPGIHELLLGDKSQLVLYE
ncbi:MAG: glucose-1-phosphate thymidylyltransferase [Firmicutes bacterium]|nr:glucose-1-phosphate thymidylyltransferase [Bacillota bacterium]